MRNASLRLIVHRSLALLVAMTLLSLAATSSYAQGDTAPEATPEERADAALADPEPTPVTEVVASAPILDLLLKGGWLMAPIAVMSIVVVAVAIERALGLRRTRVAPQSLVRGLRQLAEVGDFEPRSAYRICKTRPSATARAVMAMLAKSGRPHAEVEAAAAEAVQRESDRMYNNVRTLNLAAAVTPLMGLLGTVWGMIAAFFATAALPLGSNKGQALAEGIYVALVTTFAGLAVAIPAAVLAHYFEGRILRMLRSVEQLLGELLPHMERFESEPRIDLAQLDAQRPPLRTVSASDVDSPPSGDVDWPHPGPPAPHTAPVRQPQPLRQPDGEPWQP